MQRSFPLAKMNGLIWGLTALFIVLPFVFLVGGLGGPGFGRRFLFGPGALLAFLIVEVWLVHRPTRFTVEPGALVLVYPVRAKRIPLEGLTGAEEVSAKDLRARFGGAVGGGVGGLFGGFGWLYTSKGWVEMDISRTDGLVLLTFSNRIPLLV
ncbi:MAG: hypothetical protein AB1938_07970, partial [Myxococcota bacterium]